MVIQIAKVLCTTVGISSFILAPGATAMADEPVLASHCAIEAAVVSEADEMAEPVCFNTSDELQIYLQSVGAGAVSRSAASNTIIGTVYQDTNASGARLTLWGSSGCAGETFGFPSLASGWDNSISSARGSNGCWVTLYTATNYGGSKLNCIPYCESIGGWNDNVKSLVFRPSGTFG